VEREWLTPDGSRVEHRFDPGSGTVRAVRLEFYDRLVLSERQVGPEPVAAASLLAEALLAQVPSDADRQFACRLRFAGLAVDLPALARRACEGRRSLAGVHLADALPPEFRAELDRLSPATLQVPSGRHVRLEYGDDGSVQASVKLQEVFGLADSPRLGPRREAVRFSLLAPNGRPVQLTSDLRSFWDRLYPEVRKQLRARYPKHPWPEDPWSATPTARASRRPGR
jgi:HrpA-like RNA helicase